MHQSTRMHQSTCMHAGITCMHVLSNIHASINLYASINQHACMYKSINPDNDIFITIIVIGNVIAFVSIILLHI